MGSASPMTMPAVDRVPGRLAAFTTRAVRELLFCLVEVPLGLCVLAIPVGLPLLLLAPRVARGLGAVHRRLAARLLGEHITGPAPIRRGGGAGRWLTATLRR